MSPSVYLNDMGIVCALGNSKETVRARLFGSAPCGVAENHQLMPGQALHLGIAPEPLASLDDLPATQHSRNNRLLLTALAQIRPAVAAAITRHGRDRVAVVLGTSTSGIGDSETAIAGFLTTGQLPPSFHLSSQEMGSPAVMLSEHLDIGGPALVISTACSSSAKALASAARLLKAGLADAVITGGMDALCAFTIAGFSALESVSAERCQPLSRNRRGINIGEGGALFLMTREAGGIRLAGWGETSDGHHISAPRPDGAGAEVAMKQALARAGLTAADINYLNLHGTATRQNDAMESLAVSRLFPAGVPVSSTKPLTGHALGGAGALEAALCWLALQDNPDGLLPPHWWDGEQDPDLPYLQTVSAGQRLGRPLRHAMSNSFAFGGSNACLILGQP